MSESELGGLLGQKSWKKILCYVIMVAGYFFFNLWQAWGEVPEEYFWVTVKQGMNVPIQIFVGAVFGLSAGKKLARKELESAAKDETYQKRMKDAESVINEFREMVAKRNIEIARLQAENKLKEEMQKTTPEIVAATIKGLTGNGIAAPVSQEVPLTASGTSSSSGE